MKRKLGVGNHGPASLLFLIHLEPSSGFVSKLTGMVDTTNEREHGELKTLHSSIHFRQCPKFSILGVSVIPYFRVSLIKGMLNFPDGM